MKKLPKQTIPTLEQIKEAMPEVVRQANNEQRKVVGLPPVAKDTMRERFVSLSDKWMIPIPKYKQDWVIEFISSEIKAALEAVVPGYQNIPLPLEDEAWNKTAAILGFNNCRAETLNKINQYVKEQL